ncbi:ABC-type multidrug transport system, ATPase component [Parapedobacter composti]|uniref:ABC-type multidrug transport system, ATPase component n=1 Tax=Parapedobacter composti TaxID=623281 RepID=A0A1I1FRK7_9SPHI|nr:ATP-binding cassette domain-containing protein [Parapedobacter composti]SFC01974.1 ABC-type multidrug transport system, ATPase component [Parapedobacter composti]
MEIILEGIGRRFNRDWIFRHLDYRFTAGQRYAILGPNGSGKSTLLQVVASSLTPSAGHITYRLAGKAVEPDEMYRYLALAAPYIELIEEFSLREQLRFHFSHKNYLAGFNEQAIIDFLELHAAKDKQLRHFSSGMKQRVKLVLACCADTPLILLDEPTSNLDEPGVNWYLRLVERTAHGRLLIICSNQEREYSFCDHHLYITDYKT